MKNSSTTTTWIRNTQYTLIAEQGVRQPGKANEAGKVTLFQNDLFTSTRFPNKPRLMVIPKGCIGIVHEDAENEISVVRDDCQAARRWLNKHNQTLPK